MVLSFKDIYIKYLSDWDMLAPAIEKGIENNRKADVSIKLIDKYGNPVIGVEALIEQKRHDFIFGCNALMLGQLGENNELYERQFAKLFNLVTTTFCWRDMEPTPGVYRFEEGSEEIYRRPPVDRVVNFAKKYGLALKGQPLVADSWFPGWAPDDPEDVKKLYTSYIKEIANRYGDIFNIWDVVNEAFIIQRRTPNFPLYTPGLEFVEWAFNTARDIFPPGKGMLEINEESSVNNGPEADRYFAFVKRLIEHNVGIQAVGFQFHVFRQDEAIEHFEGLRFPLKEIYENYLRFSKIGLPLFITEITVPSKFDEVNYEKGQLIQSEVIRNLYRLWFSIPGMAGIIYWNFKDGLAWKEEGDCLGCLVDENFHEKKSYRILDQLIHKDWKTKLVSRSDNMGRIDFRGFYGDYEIVLKKDIGLIKKNFSILKHRDNSFMMVVESTN